jgi:hypothetical protein
MASDTLKLLKQLGTAIADDDVEAAAAAGCAALATNRVAAAALVDVVQCTATALVQDSKFTQALDIIETYAGNNDALTFEFVYCLYRLNRLDAAAAALAAVDEASKTEGVLHLEAQVHYKRGDAARGAAIYERYFAVNGVFNGDHEVLTNLLAALVSSGQARKAVKVAKDAAKDKEMEKTCTYARACMYVYT